MTTCRLLRYTAAASIAMIPLTASSGAIADDLPVSPMCNGAMTTAAVEIFTLQEIGPRWALERARWSLTQGRAGVRKQNQPGFFMCTAEDTHRKGFDAIEADFKAKEAIIVDGETKAGLAFVK